MTADKSDSERRPCSSTFKDMLLWPLLHAIWLLEGSQKQEDKVHGNEVMTYKGQRKAMN